MAKLKLEETKTAAELAEHLGLSPVHALEWEVRYEITNRIVETAGKEKLTVSEVARRAKTSRARVTEIMKGNSEGISINVLLKILASVGQTMKVSFKKAS